jgi:uncharacterized RDD family membrane protein YckC
VTTTPLDDTFALAGHGKRLAAALLDAIFYAVVVGAAGVAGFFVGLAAAGDSGGSEGEDWEALGWVLLGSLVGLLVGVVGWLALTVWLVQRPGSRNGQTLGKQALGIRAARASREPIGVGTALAREILAKGLLIAITSALISGVLGFVDGGSIGVLVAIAVWYGPAFVDDEHRTLHDRMLDTRVIDAKRRASPVAIPADDDLWSATPG